MTITSAPKLEDGWSPEAPDADSLVRQGVLSWADQNIHMATHLGLPRAWDDQVALARSGVPSPYTNVAVLLRPPAEAELPALIERIDAFFDGECHGIFSAFPLPDLGGHGLALMGHPPFMALPAGAAAPPLPPALEVREVATEEDLDTFCRTMGAGYPFPPLIELGAAGSMAASAFGERLRAWVGIVDGTPVATSCAYTSRGVNNVGLISCVETARRRGIGEAMTWLASLSDPRSPAVLIASDLGKPVYQRMGYLTLQRWTIWLRP